MFKKNTARFIIVFVLAITGWLGYHASQSSFDYAFEKFFPIGNTETKSFETFRNTFENDYDFLLIALENHEGIFNSRFLLKVDSFAKDVIQLSYIKKVTAPTDLKIPIMVGMGMQYRSVLHPNNDSLLKKDIERIYQSKEFIGSFFSADSSSLCIIIQTDEKLSKKKSDKLIDEIENLISSYQFDKYYLAGKIKAQQIYLNKMQEEIIFFLFTSLILVLLMLIYLFRSLRHVVIPIIVILFSIIWQLGIMQLTGKKIDLLHILLPTILFVVGMSDVVHIMNKYQEELRKGISQISAIQNALRNVGLATLITSATTAIGFISLITSPILPVREFGLYTAMGVMIAFFITLLLLPSFIVLSSNKAQSKDNKHLDRFLKKLFIFSLRYQKWLILGSFIILAIGIAGSTQVKINIHLLEDLKESEPLKKEFKYFEQNYAGTRPFEMVANSKDSTSDLWNVKSIRFLLMVEEIAIRHFELGSVQSPLIFIRFFNRAIHAGSNKYYTIPSSNQELDSLLLKMRNSGFFPSDESKLYLTEDYSKARFSAKMHDIGSYRAQHIEETFMHELSQIENDSHIKIELTGSARLIDKNISYLSSSIIKGLGLAFIVIAILFGLIFQSLKTIGVALIPNIFPLIITSGMMGFMSMDLRVVTSIIFTIGFGIAVDDTIHLLSRYRIELSKGGSELYALKRAYLSSGKAILITSFIICSGFISMMLSGFLSIMQIGLLVTVLLLSAVLFDLLLLPSLILLTRKRHGKSNIK